MSRDDGLEFSRRTFLAVAAATGTVISGGGKTVAEFSDAEEFGSQVGAGELDLDVSWEGYDSQPLLGEVRDAGDGGSADVDLSLTADSNPAWVWFATRCPSCLPIEELIDVTVELDTGSGPEVIFEGTLRAARATLGEWVQLDDVIEPGETWTLTVTWVLTEPVGSEETIDFEFDFQVAQRRHLMDPDSEKPTRDCAPCSNGGNGGTAEISYAAFGGDSNADYRDITQGFSADGRTLTYDLGAAAEAIDTIAIKYGTTLDLFTEVADSGSLTVGSGDQTDDQQHHTFAEDPTRTVNDPLPEHCWVAKYDVDEDHFEQIRECQS